MGDNSGATRIPNNTIREAVENYSESVSVIANRSGMDSSRLRRVLGMITDQRKVHDTIAVPIAEKIVIAMHKDPVDFDF